MTKLLRKIANAVDLSDAFEPVSVKHPTTLHLKLQLRTPNSDVDHLRRDWENVGKGLSRAIYRTQKMNAQKQ